MTLSLSGALVALVPIVAGIMLIVIGQRRRAAAGRTWAVCHWVVAACVGTLLCLIPLPVEHGVYLAGLPFPVAFSNQHVPHGEIGFLGPLAILSWIGNAVFAVETWGMLRRLRERKRF